MKYFILTRKNVMSLLLAYLSLCYLAGESRAAVDVISTPDSGQVPDAEVDARGVVHIAFVKGDNAFYARFGDNGKTFGKPVVTTRRRIPSILPTCFAGRISPSVRMAGSMSFGIPMVTNGNFLRINGVFFIRIWTPAKANFPNRSI